MKDDLQIIEITQEDMESMIYEIRGQKVMLDFDLARIYGYETKYLNRQVQRNIEKFPEEFMFQLNEKEIDYLVRCQIGTSRNNNFFSAQSGSLLRCQNVTTNELSPKRRYNPYVFTEQGIYMLMTVLKGELATKQSIALIKAFKQMKDYIVSSNSLSTTNELIKLTNTVNKHDRDLKTIKSKLSKVMDNFIDPSTYKHFLILNGEKIEAEIAYQNIYELAKQSILIVDDYINIKTLHLLLSAKEGVEIIIASDNVAKNRLTDEQLDEFTKESNLSITLKKSKGLCHDRWVIIDYNTQNEQLFISGASSKDGGNKITTIFKEEHSELYHPLIDKIFFN